MENTEIPTRERAVIAADALLSGGGYAAMSLDAVARGVGIRKASLYHHFPLGKDELFIAVVERRTTHDGELLARAVAGLPDAWARLQAIVAHFDGVARHRPYHALNEAAAHLPEQHREHVGRLIHERVMAPVRAVIDAGMARGEIRRADPELATLAFVTLMACLGKPARSEAQRRRLPAFIVEVFAQGLRAPAQPWASQPRTGRASPRKTLR